MRRDHELAEMLLRKAKNDQVALQELAATNSPDDVTGFHAQQAVEKCLKAVLAAREISYPFTHDLRRLIALTQAEGIPIPAEFEDVKKLTTYAAVFRYDEMDLESGALDRPWALDRVRQVIAWAESVIRED